jgi:hypothetical protein
MGDGAADGRMSRRESLSLASQGKNKRVGLFFLKICQLYMILMVPKGL